MRTFADHATYEKLRTFRFLILAGLAWYRDNYMPLIEDKTRFPDSLFSASASVEGHIASDARIRSGSSWCAPVSDEKHYLQVDFGRMYYLRHFVTYGDSTSEKWVAKYNVNYTVDFLEWKTVNRVLRLMSIKLSNIL